MKTSFCWIVLIAGFLIYSASSLCAETSDSNHNRFQLFNAEYRSSFVQKSQTTGFDEKKLFKIDTKTGATWMLIDVMMEERVRTYWKKIEVEK